MAIGLLFGCHGYYPQIISYDYVEQFTINIDILSADQATFLEIKIVQFVTRHLRCCAWLSSDSSMI